jgi:catechol 2,3-dioxygenase-like lactoylglutathione lyase family enzyme
MQTLANRPTTALSLVILLVADPAASARFYRDLFGVAPVEESPTFAMFALPSGIAVGLWSRRTVEPPMTGGPGATELCFMEEDVDGIHAAWASRGVTIAQAPTELDFGRTFVALDRDGHRLRVFRPAEEPPRA